MKKIFIYFISFLLLCGTSCTDVLNQSAVDAFDEDVVFSDINLVKAYVGACYSMLGSNKMDGNAPDGPLVRRDMLCSSTDETLNNFRPGGNDEVFIQGTMSPDRLGLFANNDNGRPWLYWTNIYRNVQNLNNILSRIDEVPVSNSSEEALRTQLKGEVYFLRALSYTFLIMGYGGGILTDKPYRMTDDFSAVRRSSIAATKDFILADVDRAIEFLPEKIEQGRGSRGAAAAAKSRMLLFCASKLANGGWAEQAGNELVSFPAGSQTALLQAARDAAKDIMDGKYGDYALVGNTSPPALPLSKDQMQQYADNFYSIFTQPMGTNWNSETIWGTQFVTTMPAVGRRYQPNVWCGPRGYDGYANNVPTEEAVRSFEMADGTKFVWDAANPGDKFTQRKATAAELAANPLLNPYNGREARFYASILYHGAPWVERPEPTNIVGNRLQSGYKYQRDASGNYPEEPTWRGVDTRQSSIPFNTDGNATKTSYNLRKFLDPKIPGNSTQNIASNNTWVEFRYAEVLLNYAEACIELGGADLQNGINALNLVRYRAGLPGRVTTNQEEAREFLRHERNIEFYGEGMRFFDIRRWMICDQVLVSVHGMRVNEYVDTDNDGNEIVLETTWQLLLSDVQDGTRNWAGNYFYWFPITRAEINKVEGLQQNPGYN